MPLNAFGTFAGGVSQGAGNLSQLMLNKRQQEYAKEAQDLQNEYLKQQIDALKFKQKQIKSQERAKTLITAAMHGQDLKSVEELPAQVTPKYGAPAGSALAQPPVPRPGATNPQDVLALLANINPQAAVNAAMQQGVIQTPAYQQQQQRQNLQQQLMMNQEQRAQSAETRAQQQEVRAEQAAKREAVNFPLKQQALRLGMQATRAKIQQQKRMQDVLGTLDAQAQTNPKAGLAAMAFRMGAPAKAIDILNPTAKAKTKYDLIQGALNGNQQDWETLRVDQELGGKGGIHLETITDKQGKTSTVFTTGDQKQGVPLSVLQDQINSLAEIDNIKATMQDFRELVKKEPSGVGILGNFSQAGQNLISQIHAMGATGDKAESYWNTAFDERMDARSRMHALGVLLGAMGTRQVLGEVGVLTNQDVARGEKIFGASSRFFNFGSAADTMSKLDQMDKALAQRERSIRNKSKIANELTGGANPRISALDEIGLKHGWIQMPPSQPPTAPTLPAGGNAPPPGSSPPGAAPAGTPQVAPVPQSPQAAAPVQPGGGSNPAPATSPGFLQQAQQILQALPMAARVAGKLGAPDIITAAKQTVQSPTVQEGVAAAGGEGIGRVAGAAVGSVAAPFMGPLAGAAVPAGTILGGALGASTGLFLNRLKNNKQVDVGDLALEFGLSLGGGALIEGGAAGMRKLLSTTRHGREATVTELGNILKPKVREAIQPPAQAEADFLWNQMRRAGMQISPSAIGEVKGLSTKELQVLRRELIKMGSGPGEQFPRIGEAMIRQIDNVRESKPALGMDIGALQHIRSQLMDRSRRIAQSAGPGGSNVKTVIDKFIGMIDDATTRGRVLRQGAVTAAGVDAKGLLAQARAATSKIKDFEDVSALIESKVLRKTPDLKDYTLDLRALENIMDPTTNVKLSKLEQAAKEALQRNPTLRSELQHFANIVQRVGIKPGPLERSEIADMVGAWLLGSGPASRQRIMRIALQKRGVLTPEDFAAAGVNLLRSPMRQQGQGKPWPKTQPVPLPQRVQPYALPQ